jgi:nicotinate-nucleotide adenylyltransferase
LSDHRVLTGLHLPAAPPGAVIGLLGGSFDPPHQGHVQITKAALQRFGLDRLWWLVSPGNPLKEHGPAPLDQRLQAARALMRHPRVAVTDVEAQLGTRYTAQTLRALVSARPDLHFVWLMGADNLAQFHLWQDWQDIMQLVPVGVLARPGQQLAGRMSKAARVYRGALLPARDSRKLGLHDAPAWCFVNLPLNDQSSSAIRARGEWVAK